MCNENGFIKPHIKICKLCNGKGKTYERTSAYDSEWLECVRCNGSGRMEFKAQKCQCCGIISTKLVPFKEGD